MGLSTVHSICRLIANEMKMSITLSVIDWLGDLTFFAEFTKYYVAQLSCEGLDKDDILMQFLSTVEVSVT